MASVNRTVQCSLQIPESSYPPLCENLILDREKKMQSLNFVKMHGCGNDYIFVDGMEWSAAQIETFNFGTVSRIVSDRRRSIGGDGLVAMLPSGQNDADARMRMFNADGSEGNLCGNALRCMAMWLHQSGRCGVQCRIAMHNRLIDAEIVTSDSEERKAIVRVTIGMPVVLAPAATGMQRYVRHTILTDILLNDQPTRITEVSLGNPHAIVSVAEVDSLEIERLGPRIERHPVFPNRTNVEFVQITGSNQAVVRVWERGSGETLACGSGACAVAVMGWVTKRFCRDEPVRVQMRGGELVVRITSTDSVSLEGPAEESGRGEVILNIVS